MTLDDSEDLSNYPRPAAIVGSKIIRAAAPPFKKYLADIFHTETSTSRFSANPQSSLLSPKEISPIAAEMFCSQWVPKQPLLCSFACSGRLSSKEGWDPAQGNTCSLPWGTELSHLASPAPPGFWFLSKWGRQTPPGHVGKGWMLWAFTAVIH